VTVFVLDNSVTMRWFFDSGLRPYADSILRNMTTLGDEAIVPVLWAYEVSAVLARAQNKAGIAAQEVTDFLDDLEALPITIDGESAGHIFSDVHSLALIYRLTSYDAAYLELALRRNLPVATLDAELVTACTSAGVPLR
jgi:predicted nucleic acid-binding protein